MKVVGVFLPYEVSKGSERKQQDHIRRSNIQYRRERELLQPRIRIHLYLLRSAPRKMG
jgi:hypothetical protein